MITFNFTDFSLSEYGMILKEVPETIGDMFSISYFDGSYKEVFKFKRALINDKTGEVEHLYNSNNGNRVLIQNRLTNSK